MPKLMRLLSRDATLRSCWSSFQAGDISLEQTLTAMVVFLAERNERLSEEITRFHSERGFFARL
jgi:siroheme synthase (precorrin-2 oxidase/ferrochelatase)